MSVRPFTPLATVVPDYLIASLRSAEENAVCCCRQGQPTSGHMTITLFVKCEYRAIQPIVDAPSVPVNLELRSDLSIQPAGAAVLIAELVPANCEPEMRYKVTAAFPWDDAEAVANLVALLEQPMWAFLLISNSCEMIYNTRVYQNPMTDEDKARWYTAINRHVNRLADL